MPGVLAEGDEMTFRKYRAVPTIVNGIRFASKAEARRYSELSLMEKAGKISGLQLQPSFKFPCGVSYRADFAYEENGLPIVEDVKGMRLPLFNAKEKMFRFHYPKIEFRITK